MCNFNPKGAVTETALCPTNVVCTDFWSEWIPPLSAVMKDAPATWPHSLLHQLRSGLWRLRLCFLSCYLSKTERQQHRQPQLSANTQGSPQGQSPPLPEPGDESLLLFPITSGTVALLCTHTQTCLWKPPRLSDFCHHFSRGTQMHTAWWEKEKKKTAQNTYKTSLSFIRYMNNAYCIWIISRNRSAHL